MRRLAHRTFLAIAVAGLMAAVGAVPAEGSTFLGMDVPQLVAKSEVVVQGRVIQLESRWDREGRVIVTDALVEVEESVFGASEGQVWVRTFGGTVGDYTVEAIGFPRFDPEERVLLFLERRGREDMLHVTGYQLGHYRIVERQGREFAVPTLEQGVNLITKSGQAAVAPREASLDQFKSEIRVLASRGLRLSQ